MTFSTGIARHTILTRLNADVLLYLIPLQAVFVPRIEITLASVARQMLAATHVAVVTVLMREQLPAVLLEVFAVEHLHESSLIGGVFLVIILFYTLLYMLVVTIGNLNAARHQTAEGQQP